MDIYILKCLLEELDEIGIDKVVFDPQEEGTLVKGADKNAGVLVYHTILDELSEDAIGIQSVKGLLSRVHLFDDKKASIDLESSDGRVYNINIKQGRKKASFRCMENPKGTRSVPSTVPGSLDFDVTIEFSEEYVNYISRGISAMGYTGEKDGRNIGMKLEDGQLDIKIYDGDMDSFVDVLEIDNPEEVTRNGTWDVNSFQRIMKYSSKVNKEKKAKFTITEYEMALFELERFNAIAAPVVPR